MKILLAASEAIPYAKTGGLADVIGALSANLRAMRIDARLIIPLYRGIKNRFHPERTGLKITIPMGGDEYTGSILLHEKHTIFIECGEFFDRGELYGTPKREYEDNSLRFIFFSKAVLEASKALGFMPDVIHCNDWHTGLVPLYMKSTHRYSLGSVASLFTIHNLEYQGIFPMSAMTLTGLGMDMFNPDALEFYGRINLMKAGIVSADAVNTVSVNYSDEILRPENGFGLDGILSKRSSNLSGIINGIDYGEWDPSTDGYVQENFSREDLSGKKACKKALAKKCSFTRKDAPILGMVGRISSQKGIEVLMEAAGGLLSYGVNLAVLGKGEERLHAMLKGLAKSRPGEVSVNIGFDNELAHMIFAGSDMLLIPSVYEPCGLTQMIAMRYGTVPVARATGGLVDTVDDYVPLRGKGTGFLFSDYTPSALTECVKRALCVYTDREKWERLVLDCMGKDFSSRNSAKKYASLYRAIRKAEKI
jgi:starch synthase